MRYAVAGAFVLAALLLDGVAWYAGYRANLGLLWACYLARVLLLLAALVPLLMVWDRWGDARVIGRPWVTGMMAAAIAFVICGCMGNFPFWFLGLVLPAALLVRLRPWRAPPPGMTWQRMALDATALSALYLITWWLSAVACLPFLHGLGKRLDERGADGPLRTWAAGVIVGAPRGAPLAPGVLAVDLAAGSVAPLGSNPLGAVAAAAAWCDSHAGPWPVPDDQVPPFVGELLGRRPEVPFRVLVVGGPKGAVIVANGSPYYYLRARVSPTAPTDGSEWLKGVYRWKPGIELQVLTPPK